MSDSRSEKPDNLPKISMEGATAILVDAAGPQFSTKVQARLWALADRLRLVHGIDEAVPGMNNLMLVFNPMQIDPDDLESHVLRQWAGLPDEAPAGPITEVPVVYGGEAGEDLDALAAEKGMTRAALVALHAGAIYTVAAVGAMPGFVYLSGLDPALATPRRANPRMAVKKGSVIIGGQQAGIMPVTAPSGWHIIGHTDHALFDPHRDPPAAFRPGDRIRFVAKEVLG